MLRSCSATERYGLHKVSPSMPASRSERPNGHCPFSSKRTSSSEPEKAAISAIFGQERRSRHGCYSLVWCRSRKLRHMKNDGNAVVTNHKIVSHEEWLAERKALLAKEKEFN